MPTAVTVKATQSISREQYLGFEEFLSPHKLITPFQRCVRTSTKHLRLAHPGMDRSPVRRNKPISFVLFHTAFTSASIPLVLTYSYATRGRSTKSTPLYLFSILGTCKHRFQVLISLPPGFLFTFLTSNYSQSVTGIFTLRSGPASFQQGFFSSCTLFCFPVFDFGYKLTSLWLDFPFHLPIYYSSYCKSYPNG